MRLWNRIKWYFLGRCLKCGGRFDNKSIKDYPHRYGYTVACSVCGHKEFKRNVRVI